MAPFRWEPAREITALQGEMNRLFSSLIDTPAPAGAPRRWVPAVDVAETGEAFVLKADLPGVAEDDVSVEIEGGVLTISGERRAEHEEEREGWYRVERSFGAFRRAVTLPDGVDPERVRATFDRGVLEVRIPRPASQVPHRVRITVGGEAPDVEGREVGAASGTTEGGEAGPAA